MSSAQWNMQISKKRKKKKNTQDEVHINIYWLLSLTEDISGYNADQSYDILCWPIPTKYSYIQDQHRNGY